MDRLHENDIALGVVLLGQILKHALAVCAGENLEQRDMVELIRGDELNRLFDDLLGRFDNGSRPMPKWSTSSSGAAMGNGSDGELVDLHAFCTDCAQTASPSRRGVVVFYGEETSVSSPALAIGWLGR